MGIFLDFETSEREKLNCNSNVTDLPTPWCRVLLEKLTGLKLIKKFPAFHGTRRFITAFTSVRHLSLSWASPIQSIYPHPTSWRSILILSTHLRLGLPIGLFPSGFPTKTLYTPLSSPIRATCPAQCNSKVLIKFTERRRFWIAKRTCYVINRQCRVANTVLLTKQPTNYTEESQ